jgi:hypothetical protein
MDALLYSTWGAEGMSQTCVILFTLISTGITAGVQPHLVINDKYRDLVTARARDGKCIDVAEMEPSNTNHWITWDDMNSDGIHPNVCSSDCSQWRCTQTNSLLSWAAGHKKTAAAFYKAINQAAADGKLVTPSAFDNRASTSCDKFAGNRIHPSGKTQRGFGTDDGIYQHDTISEGVCYCTPKLLSAGSDL